ncbi:hypothetical protein [Nodularia sp. UHCC 0506]|uniref:hypothetical protein n=1 Tax=Nodularia sp. UHCC 0506 TaxID=3110243 RepID=UPI002B20C552|nr:hypothetical protein [Nodularia sp. UHCC 0506]MEA5515413.1 hypothetical protein [Nodularia sp. UHCC 0506]
MIGFLLLFIVLISPTLLILWSALARFGFNWNLLLIPVGSIVGFVLMAIAGASLYEFIIWLNDRQTGSPPAGSLGAGTGRAILTFILMVLFGWIGSGIGAWLVRRYWVG